MTTFKDYKSISFRYDVWSDFDRYREKISQRVFRKPKAFTNSMLMSFLLELVDKHPPVDQDIRDHITKWGFRPRGKHPKDHDKSFNRLTNTNEPPVIDLMKPRPDLR